MRLGLFIPCFVDSFYPSVAIATVHILEHLGLRPEYPEQQTCCGQPHFNAGHREQARELARHFCEVFRPFDAIVCPSGSCTAMVRHHYPQLVDSPVSHRVFELCEFLVNQVGVTDLGACFEGRAALHIGCHALRELRIENAVHTLMRSVQGLCVVPTPSDSFCCGFGGTFSVKFPEISTAMGQRKLGPIRQADVDFVISTDSSCSMHLGGLLDRQKIPRPKLVHVAEVLASGLEAT
ncbi:MAG TPA: (Fe-S)-binding protein [Polyangiaceae bacterium]|nr:MAG: Lactate utilization protein A [Deltaproteobacteria bacterium ADurb.Bin207]HNS96959.1 (Fe-S)-binding protein [Polyangiaceae bacterium]HNZ20756.1 (Fe-S)-binding protein [Polyangiaceae bacterium]HOD23831.1 (Fe-S)-binding protein [Polyangiaceae bacterium]HOE49173.1 (Fe-S)-binding protein [Polyangiaceae bacterium]